MVSGTEVRHRAHAPGLSPPAPLFHLPYRERDFFMHNLVVRIHSVMVMIWWAGLASWVFGRRAPRHRAHAPGPSPLERGSERARARESEGARARETEPDLIEERVPYELAPSSFSAEDSSNSEILCPQEFWHGAGFVFCQAGVDLMYVSCYCVVGMVCVVCAAGVDLMCVTEPAFRVCVSPC